MASIMVGIRQKTAAVIHSLVEAHAAEVAAVVEPRLRSLLKPGEVLPDFTLVLLLLGRMVAEAALLLVASDRAHQEELEGDVEPRVQRDQAAHTVRRKLVEIRKLAAAVFGRQQGDKIFGLTGRTARAAQPELLWQQTRKAIDRLRDPELVLPATEIENVFAPSALVRGLEPHVAALRQALDAVGLERRQAESTLAAKSGAMGSFDVAEKASVGILAGFFHLARRPDLARQIRALLRRRRAVAPTREPSPTAGGAAPSVHPQPQTERRPVMT